MTKPQSLPVEEARKKFADVLDGSQFRSTHTEITRRGKPAGYVVPPEWYDGAAEALAEVKALRRKVEELSATTPPMATKSSPPRPAATPRQQPARPKPESREGRPLTDEEAKTLAELARSRADDLQTRKLDQDAAQARDAYKDFTVVSSALSMGLLTHDEVYGTNSEEQL